MLIFKIASFSQNISKDARADVGALIVATISLTDKIGLCILGKS